MIRTGEKEIVSENLGGGREDKERTGEGTGMDSLGAKDGRGGPSL